MNAPERIAFDARYINDRYQGIGRYAFRLLEAMVMAAPEHTFMVFRGREKDSRFDWETLASRPNVELWQGPWPLYWPHEQVRWPRLLRQSRADLFHSPYFVAPLLAPCPVVITVHDLIFDRYPAYMPWAWSRPYYRLLMRLSNRRARRTIAVSQATGADLAHYYTTPPDKIVIIPEGVEQSFAATAEPRHLHKLRERYGLTQPFILNVGARRPHKNLARLVRAFASLDSSIAHTLVFVGPADSRFPDDARQAAAEAGLNGRIRFLDWVPENDLAALYAAADLVVVPSLVEGFGLPALEAMASGTPVLAANTSSLPEVIGDAGLLVDPSDEIALAAAMCEILNDLVLWQRLAAAGKARAARFTWREAAQQTLKVYQEVQR
ncbi:MAG TPA: glycosyltransferase family 1 protein [Anaerolineae bacterium]|nr:glycosyltransferase family 1 protein [Anaerolineae bacterium]